MSLLIGRIIFYPNIGIEELNDDAKKLFLGPVINRIQLLTCYLISTNWRV